MAIGVTYAQIFYIDIELKIDSLLNDINGKQLPGSLALIVNDGDVLLNKGYVLANNDYNILSK